MSVCVVSVGVVLCHLKKYNGPDLGECVCVVSVGIVLCDLKNTMDRNITACLLCSNQRDFLINISMEKLVLYHQKITTPVKYQ